MTQRPRLTIAFAVVAMLAAGAATIAWSQLPAIGAGAMLYPARRVPIRPVPAPCVERDFAGVNARLSGWVCTPETAGRPAIVYLHGIADNRDSALNVVDRFVRRGHTVIAYDSRGHGRSEGDRCTYGFLEKQDVRLALDQAGIDRAIVIGHSLGAAVALQAAAIDRRIIAVVAASTFSDLRTIATERAPFVFTPATIAAAFARAEHDGQFIVDEASPLRAAAAISVPVLLVHGAEDRNTRPTHSERVYAALGGPKELLLVAGAAHVDVFRSEVWTKIERWIDALP